MKTRITLCLLTLWPAIAQANAPDCAAIAEATAAQSGIPQGVMAAISLVETGKGGKPWPWTLNEGGKGMHFDTKAEALAYLEQAVARGVTNIDVGCMQLNYRWHSASFESLEQMIDPEANTRYAAFFLNELKARLGSWDQAVADYHSADPARGANYRDKVASAMRGGGGADGMPASDAVADGRPSPYLATLSQGGDLAALIGASAAAAAAMLGSDGPMPDLPESTKVALRAQDELPARIGSRWQVLQEIRATLAENGS